MSPDSAIERILELSAEAQIKRREAAADSPAFHNLTGAIEFGFLGGCMRAPRGVQRAPWILSAVKKHANAQS